MKNKVKLVISDRTYEVYTFSEGDKVSCVFRNKTYVGEIIYWNYNQTYQSWGCTIKVSDSEREYCYPEPDNIFPLSKLEKAML